MDIKKIESFIDKQEVAFITSIDEEGFPNIKAMLMPKERVGIKEFYFSTNTSSLRVTQYLNNNKAAIYFYNKGKIKYEGLMLIGTMEVIMDNDIKAKYWKMTDRIYYHGGKTDPDYCILKFTATSGRYYCDLDSESIVIQ